MLEGCEMVEGCEVVEGCEMVEGCEFRPVRRYPAVTATATTITAPAAIARGLRRPRGGGGVPI